MAKTDAESELTGSELTRATASAGAADHTHTVFIGIAGGSDADQIRERSTTLSGDIPDAIPGTAGVRFTLAYPGPELARTPLNGQVDLLAYPVPSGDGAASPWSQFATAQAELLRLASEAGARAAVLLHPDLAAMTPEALGSLLGPILTQHADLVVASYASGPYDTLLNTALLAPLTRALYGPRVRFPLAPEFAVSARLAARLGMHAQRQGNGTGTGAPLLWPSMAAASGDMPVLEAPLSLSHATRSGDMELSAVIAQLVGSAFTEMEAHAPLWQRVRPSPVPVSATEPLFGATPSASAPIDTAPMINSFLLGSRSLGEVWGLVLPPVTLLDLKRLSLVSPEQFHMPDELWVRIVYDFALAYRLRTINRVHLLGALTPLYLGWVASYVQESISQPGFEPRRTAERLALAFEAGKPYLVRRWRWPDRFNP